jgi:acetyltransferase-like isoleucine patch superfamily enzyme
MSVDGEYPDVRIADDATVGGTSGGAAAAPAIGPESIIRSGTVIYDDVRVGARLQTGHHAVIRAATTMGDDCLVGTHAVIDGQCRLGDAVRLQTGAYVPMNTKIGDRVFLGPNATLLNDPSPVRTDADLVGPTLADDVSVGGTATVLPGVSVGEAAFVAAGAVVTADVPPDTLAVGVPARHRPLPADLQGGNAL